MDNEDTLDFLQELRDLAVEESEKSQEKELVDRSVKGLKRHRTASLKSAKEHIDMARKPRMRTVEFYLCDMCDDPIMDPEDGFVVQGNIYAADASCRGGLVGNNFPKDKETFTVDEVKENIFCKSCLGGILGLSEKRR